MADNYNFNKRLTSVNQDAASYRDTTVHVTRHCMALPGHQTPVALNNQNALISISEQSYLLPSLVKPYTDPSKSLVK